METVLAVDDSDTMRRAVAMSLEAANYRVILAKDGFEALAKFKEHGNVALVVTDTIMPRLDGVELITRIREQNEEIPILLLANGANDEHCEKAVAAGANAWLAKPFAPDRVVEAVHQLLGRGV